MDRDKFRSLMRMPKKLNPYTAKVEKKFMDSVIRKSIDKSPKILGKKGNYNLIIVMEELSELQKEISKHLRGRKNKVDIIEEAADVIIAMEYVKIVCNITDADISRAINIKLDSLDNRLKNGGFD